MKLSREIRSNILEEFLKAKYTKKFEMLCARRTSIAVKFAEKKYRSVSDKLETHFTPEELNMWTQKSSNMRVRTNGDYRDFEFSGLYYYGPRAKDDYQLFHLAYYVDLPVSFTLPRSGYSSGLSGQIMHEKSNVHKSATKLHEDFKAFYKSVNQAHDDCLSILLSASTTDQLKKLTSAFNQFIPTEAVKAGVLVPIDAVRRIESLAT